MDKMEDGIKKKEGELQDWASNGYILTRFGLQKRVRQWGCFYWRMLEYGIRAAILVRQYWPRGCFCF